MVHAPIPDTCHEINNHLYFSVHYNCPCHRWTGIVDRRGMANVFIQLPGSQFIYFSKYAAPGSSHDLTCYYQENLDVKLENLNSWLIADGLYEGGARLLTPYSGRFSFIVIHM